MNKATDPVLELLDDVGIAISPNAIMYELNQTSSDPPHRSSVYRAMDDLEKRDYICRPKGEDTRLVQITERGREYLRGERDASEDA